MIARRYLKHRTNLMRAALARLAEDSPEGDGAEDCSTAEEAAVEEPLRLNDQRLGAVTAELKQVGAKSVIDLGCGEGKLLRLLLQDAAFERLAGMDVSYRGLEIAHSRLNLDRLPPKQRQRIELFHGSLMYADSRLAGFDAATLVEVIEHFDPPRLAACERVVFERARPRVVIVTTPNAEYNVRFETLPAGRFRHKDHRFEWTRAEFEHWGKAVARNFGYDVRFASVGPPGANVGSPTQMAVFLQL
jgi:3' terminal RNA ribose 2'-O-methyltransferase Hen1